MNVNMEMDFNEFMLLSPEERYLLVWTEGKYIMGRINGEYTYNLYSLFNYYAEITFNLPKNCLEGIQIFQNLKFLDSYLEEIILPSFGFA